MKRILVPSEFGADWQRLLAQPDVHWQRGKSAMTTAACWEAATDRLPAEVHACLAGANHPALRGLELLLAVPEWEVSLPGGKTASHTDVLALARNDEGLVVLAVEAKVDEEFGPTLGAKRQEPSPGQVERLQYLHTVLGLAQPLSDHMRYQLVHRTASAILTARAFHAATAVMLVQSFSTEQRWRGDFDAFAEALGTASDKASIVGVPGHTRPSLFLAWCAGDQRYRDVDLLTPMPPS